MMHTVFRGAAVFVGTAAVAYLIATSGFMRQPSGIVEGREPVADQDLHQSVDQVLSYLQSNQFNVRSCGSALKDVFGQAFVLRPDQLDSAKLRARASETIRYLFLIRLALRSRLAEFERAGPVDDLCLSGIRDALRAARVVEDYVAEWFAGYPKHEDKRPVAAFEGGFPYLQLAGDVPSLELRSGDVILSRGTAFTSAAISRIAVDDANFSHLAIVYIDEATGERKVVEAHIEIGSVVTPLDVYRKDGKARAVVFRFKEPALAHEAAKAIHERVRAAQASGENICYDFGMDLSDRNCLFCSEIVSAGFAMASGDRVRVPRFLSRIEMKNRDFLNRIGVTASLTFAPADIEVDPRFELIAEWRDLTRVNLLHEHDAILTAMFEWMEQENYILYPTAMASIQTSVAWQLRRWPLFSYLLKDKFPKNMPQSALAAVTTLDVVGGALMQRLDSENERNRKLTQFWLTPRQMLTVLHAYRREDLVRYQDYLRQMELEARGDRPADFHYMFRKK